MPQQYGYGAAVQRVCFTCYEKSKATAGGTATVSAGGEESLVIQFYLRGLPYDFVSSLQQFGRRAAADKSYALACMRNEDQTQIVVQLYSGRRALLSLQDESNSRSFLRAMDALKQHPYIAPTVHVTYDSDKDRTIVMRPYATAGSLKDLIRRGSPNAVYGKKYQKGGDAQKLSFIGRCGRQILLAVQYLQGMGLTSLPHLHAANVLVSDGQCCLSDLLESHAMGLNPLYNQYSTSKAPGAEVVDFFGQILWELATGDALQSRDVVGGRPMPPAAIQQPLLGILVSIWSEQPPTVESLLQNPFFAAQPGMPAAAESARPPKLPPNVVSYLAGLSAASTRLFEQKAAQAFSPITSPVESPSNSPPEPHALGSRSGSAILQPDQLLRIDAKRSDPLDQPSKIVRRKSKKAMRPMSAYGTASDASVTAAAPSGLASPPRASHPTTSQPPPMAAPLPAPRVLSMLSPRGGDNGSSAAAPLPPTRTTSISNFGAVKAPASATSPPLAMAAKAPPGPPPPPAKGAPPPPPPPGGKGAPPPPPPPKGGKAAGRPAPAGLLSSIEGFGGLNKLKKTATKDRSVPRV
jgi:hypothetical protein